jgi:hypothetical protein
LTEDNLGIGLGTAIEMLRREFEAAIRSAATAEVQFPVQDVMIELSVVASSAKEGKAGFVVPFVGAELGGSMGRTGEHTQKVTVRLCGPVNQAGDPVKVADLSDQDKH